ncbi:Imm6 family immunity protein [Streptococcus oralis]|uniref:Imm6 family immunity protein n=1 Tax=Streptococcus oralis TaxID=1303 RepID=UPI003EE18FC1
MPRFSVDHQVSFLVIKGKSMNENRNLLRFLQELIYGLVDLISEKEYQEFVLDSLKLSKQELDKESDFCPDILYNRLENIDEQDILTFQVLDKKTNPLVWNCIANFFVLVCHYSYIASEEIYLPQTIESVDEDILEVLSLSYKQILAENRELISQITGPEIEGYFKDELVKNYFGPLFLSDENE